MASQGQGVPGAPGQPTLPPFATLPICDLQTGAPTQAFYQFLRQLWGVAQALGFVAAGSVRLVAGQALIGQPNVGVAGSSFLVTAQDNGLAGSVSGELGVIDQIPDTSFVIKSTNSSDTRLVFWLMAAPPTAIPP